MILLLVIANSVSKDSSGGAYLFIPPSANQVAHTLANPNSLCNDDLFVITKF